MRSAVGGILVIHKGAEHSIAVADMMTIDCYVFAGRLIIRAFQGKQATQLAFLPGKQVMEVILCVIRAHNGVIDLCAGYGKPGNKIPVLSQTRIQINAGACLRR